MVIKILNRWNDRVLYETEAGDIRAALVTAAADGADLSGADLRGADLRGADLRGADLGGANLGDANLGDANLGDADLGDADLGGANLGGADLGGANLGGANLGGANLGGANLGGANLGGANLGDANLGDANLGDADLQPFRDDIWVVLSSAPAEAPAVLAALRSGSVDGSTYRGACACLVGTIANARGCQYDAIPSLAPNANRPAEQWFMGIKQGDTPETNMRSNHAAEWVEDWIGRMREAFGPRRDRGSSSCDVDGRLSP